MNKLFEHLSDENIFQLNSVVETLTQQITLEQLANEIEEETSTKTNWLYLEMMKEPNLFNALIILKAADKLSMTINVNQYDVFDCFGVLGVKNVEN